MSEQRISDKIKNKHGLAQIASQWFMDTHAHYLLASKDAFTKIDQPLLLLGGRVDKEKLAGKKGAALTEVFLILKLGLVKAAASVPFASLASGIPQTADTTQMAAAAKEVLTEKVGDVINEGVKILRDATINKLQQEPGKSDKPSGKGSPSLQNVGVNK